MSGVVWNNIHIDGTVPANGSQIDFQSKTSIFKGVSGSTGTCSVGCRNRSGSVCLSWHPSDGGVGFVPECRLDGMEGRHCRLEGAGETHCGSFRLRVPCTGTSVCIESRAPSRVPSVYSGEAGRSCEDPGDVGDEYKNGKGKMGADI